jgi:hypothetical protein
MKNERKAATTIYQNIVHTLRKRGLIAPYESLPLLSWAGPAILGVQGFVFVIDERRISKPEVLHTQSVLDHIATNLHGVQVGYSNTQGLAYWVLLKKSDKIKPIDLLPLTDAFECAMIVGNRNSGKTTLCRHVMRRRRETGWKIIVYDPKPLITSEYSYRTPFDKWPGAHEVVGMNGDFAGIAEHMSILVNRSEKMTLANTGQRVLVIIDEYVKIIARMPDVVGHLISIYINGREAGVDVFVVSHSSRVEVNGLSGRGDILAGMAQIRFQYNQLTGERKAIVDWGEGPVVAELPGEFTLSPTPTRDRGFSPEPAKSPSSPPLLANFTKEDAWLAILIERNNGRAPVSGIFELIKNNAPAAMWQARGVWTSYKIGEKFKEWETLGLLLPESRDERGYKQPRMITDELRKLVSIHYPHR